MEARGEFLNIRCVHVASKKQDKHLEGIEQATKDMLFGQTTANGGRYAYLNGGGAKFNEFIRNNENYPSFWKEGEILSEHGQAMATEMRDVEHAVIVGPGSAFAEKEFHVIKHLPNLKKVTFIDIAEKFNQAARQTMTDMKAQLAAKNVSVTAITGPFQDIDKKATDRWAKDYKKTLVMCVGSLITNIEKLAKDSYPETETQSALRDIFRLAANDGYAIIGYNALEKQSTLQKAYANAYLAEFMLNAWHFMLLNSPDIRIEDINGNPLDKNDRAVINDLFAYEMDDPKFDPQTRNYAHIIKAKKSFRVYAKDDSVQDGSFEEICKDIEAGFSFTMINSYQASTSIVNTQVNNLSKTSKFYEAKEMLARGKENIYLHSFRITPKAPAQP